MTGRAVATHAVSWTTMTSALAVCGVALVRLLARHLPWKSRILAFAAREGRLDAVLLLLEAGADPNVSNRSGTTVLTTAVRNGNTQMARALLRAGADPNLRGWGESITPLAAGIEAGRPEAVTALLNAGADPEASNHNGATVSSFGALSWAAYHGSADMAELLLQAGADPDPDGGHPDTRVRGYGGGWRPVAVAAGEGHTEIVQVLLAVGADPNPENEQGVSALELAARQGHAGIAQLIRQAGIRGVAPAPEPQLAGASA